MNVTTVYIGFDIYAQFQRKEREECPARAQLRKN